MWRPPSEGCISVSTSVLLLVARSQFTMRCARLGLGLLTLSAHRRSSSTGPSSAVSPSAEVAPNSIPCHASSSVTVSLPSVEIAFVVKAQTEGS